MSACVLEAVPNFSEGRDLGLVRALADAMATAGAEVLDCSTDRDHNRAVITLLGEPRRVEAAVLASAAVAMERIDLRRHRGVHPRIGALDVAPFVPLAGLTMADARESAHRVGARLSDDLRLPVFFYAHASDPPGRRLAELREGGFEALVQGWPEGRRPDRLPEGWAHPGAHPSAGAACVGARPLMLAWNVYLEGVSLKGARRIARQVRERDGGFPGLRALALELPTRKRLQISMNLEELGTTSPLEILRRIEELARHEGGSAGEVEVIGMIPDELLLTAAANRLRLSDAPMGRLLSRRLAEHLASRPQSGRDA